jgi:hypothetical protein
MNKEDLAKQIHTWYLEASQKLHPESFNPEAQKSYEDLTEEQKYLDRYLAEQIVSLLSTQQAEIKREIHKISVERIEDDLATKDFQLGWNEAVQEQKDRIKIFLSSLSSSTS